MTILSMLCRQPEGKLTAKLCRQPCTTPGKLLPCGPRQVLCRQPDGKLTAKRAVNSATGLSQGLAVRETLPSAWAKWLTAKPLPSVDFKLTAKQLTAD